MLASIYSITINGISQIPAAVTISPSLPPAIANYTLIEIKYLVSIS